MPKSFFILCSLVLSFLCRAQINIKPTDRFSIEENGKPISAFSVSQADSFNAETLGDIMMVNSKGEEKGVRKDVKGFLLKDILRKTVLSTKTAKELLQYYFLLEATDGYKALLSYNEVFNNRSLYVITESNKITLSNSPDRIELIALAAPNKGHIYIKGLTRLTIYKSN